jgi:hypothetical protein
MGVDISGRNPIVRSPKPTIDWETATEEQKTIYFKESDIWETENPGDYFRANWWSWRPIVMLIEMVNEQKDLGIDMNYYGSNDGAGLEDQDSCNDLADALQEILDGNPNLAEEDDRIHVVMGSWVDLEGRFIPSEKLEAFEDQLPKVGTIMYSSFIAPDGTILQSAHSTSRWHLENFIAFLRECGGFEIW